MPTNFYFNNFPLGQVTQEQLLVEDLVIEAMQIHGMDVYYLPRATRDEVDMLYGEDTLKVYNKAYHIEMYLENVTGMDGEQDFISKFGLEIRDEVTMLMSRRRFKYVTKGTNIIRPNEGDLVYIPLLQNFFEITFVEHENNQAMFYTLGRGRGGNVYVYAMRMKQFVFSEEIIQTGISEIDDQIRDSYQRTRIVLTDAGAQGIYEQDEIVFQSTDGTLANASASAVVYSVTPTGVMDVIRLSGEWKTGNIAIGNTTNARWAVVSIPDGINNESPTSPFDNNVFEDIVDNTRIETESDAILDWSERNPFGEA